jgi:hypothetical protein
MAPSGFQNTTAKFLIRPSRFPILLFFGCYLRIFFVAGRSGNPIPVELISDRVFDTSVMFRPILLKNVYRTPF